MRHNRFANLDTTDVIFACIANHFAFMDANTINEVDITFIVTRVNLGNLISIAIFFKFARMNVNIVAKYKCLRFAADSALRLCIEFKYNKSKDSFIIPITGITPIFSPRITGTKREGDRTILTVDCLSTTAHTVDKYGNDVPPEPSKTVRITLINSPDGSYHISALQAVN